MNSPEETQLSDDLRHIVADPPFTPDVEAIERQGQRQRRRGFAIRGLAGVTVLGVAVAGSLAAATHWGGTTGKVAGQTATRTVVGKAAPKTAAKAPAPVKAETVAYVEKRMAAAASGLNNYLVKSRQNTSSIGSPSVEITIWTDPRTGNTMLLQGSGASRLSYWEHDYFDSHRVLNWDSTQVNYGPRTWWTQDQKAGGPVQGPLPQGAVGGDYNTPGQVKQWLAQGVGKIVGHPYVDGHHTVELSISAGPAKTSVLFADVHTYQVVRSIDYFNQVPGAQPITANYQWAPRSPAMVKLVNHPVIPAGYTQVGVGY
jgi:hypothetical protein